MKEKITLLLLFLLLMWTTASQCPVLCDTCPSGGTTCSSCYPLFQYDAASYFITSGTCPCPDGFWMQATTRLCIYCPITCATCQLQTRCTTCIEGYELDKDKLCVKRVSNAGQWLTLDIAEDLTQQKLSKVQIEGFYLTDHVSSLSISNSVKNCSGLGSRLFFGLFSFDYNTQIYKSYYGLAHHDWVQIRFQFIAADRWRSTSMILQINDRESYKLSFLEGVQVDQQKVYSSLQRHRNFCMLSDPDNLGFINLYFSHTASMLKIRIRTDLSGLGSVNPADYPAYVYFGLRNLFVRAGTCPTNCRKCVGPNLCADCIKPYTSSAQGSCQCDTTIAQITQFNNCVLKCPSGYVFTKMGSMTQSKCMLCSSLSQQLNDCKICEKVSTFSIQCKVCNQGFYLNATGYCVQSCPSNTYVFVNITAQGYKMECKTCGDNCIKCVMGTCSSCVNNRVMQNGVCVASCLSGFYLETSLNQCYMCPLKCATCVSSKLCTTCEDSQNYTIASGLCVPKCRLTNNCTFTPCHSKCATCFGSQINQCLSCSLSTDRLQNFACVEQCTLISYSYDTDLCGKCLYPCASCLNALSCTYCQKGYFLFKQQCITTCPLSYYSDPASIKCQLCSENCKSCFNATTCVLCANSYTLYSGNCILQKPCAQLYGYGFYYDEKLTKCMACSQNCTTCYKDLCFRCNDDSVLDNGKCMERCSSEKVQFKGQYLDAVLGSTFQYRYCRWRDPLCNKYALVAGNSVCVECIFMNPMLVFPNSTLNDQCSFTCPIATSKVQINNTVTCWSCPANCQQCLTNRTCILCTTNYVINPIRSAGLTQCLANCPQGYTSDGYQCLSCKTNCKICDITGKCLTCLDNFIMSSTNNCMTDVSCLSSQFRNTDSVCLNCPSGCLTCVGASVCTSCGTIFTIQSYLKVASCVLDCGSGFFAFNQGFQCRKCPLQCLTCVSSTQCTVCTQGFYLLLHPIQRIATTLIGTCVRQCPSGYFNYNPLNTDRQISTCNFCAQNCLTCFGPSSDQCLTCYGSFKMILNSRCVERCPVRMYQDVNGHCDWCHPSCTICTGPAQYQCTACEANHYLSFSVCYNNSCPGSTYPVDYDSRVCELCQWGCQVCSNPYNCSVCTGGFYLYEGWCYLVCPANTVPYFNSTHASYRCKTCTNQWSKCLECSSSKCSRCQWPYYLLNNLANGSTSCTLTCPYGYYFQPTPSPQCLVCASNCLFCTSSSECIKCSVNYVLNNGICSFTCPLYQFYSRLSMSCKNCSSFCISCPTQTQCSNCMPGYFLMSEAVNTTSVTSYCTINCGDFYFRDQSSGSCQRCSSNCKTCLSISNCSLCLTGYNLTNGYCYSTNTTNNTITCTIPQCSYCQTSNVCQVCQIPYYLSVTINLTTKVTLYSCLSACPVGYYTLGRTCQICNLTCTSCVNGFNDCNGCVTGLYLFERRCWKQCPVSSYKDFTVNQCIKCPSFCYQCNSSSNCDTCQSSYYLYKDICYETCPSMTYKLGTTCVNCLSNCLTCQSAASCTECISPYINLEGKCVDKCPLTYYLSLGDMTCKRCVYPCAFCRSETLCLTCLEGLILTFQATKCVSDCPIGYFPRNSSSFGFQCTACAVGCNTCVNSTYCTRCNDALNTYDGKCMLNCPIGTYLEPTNRFCLPCSLSCLACSSLSSCIQCHNQTVLYNGKCVQFCPIGTYQISQFSYALRSTTSVCKICIPPCKQCDGPTVYSCLSCVNGLYFYQNLCLDACPIGFFADSQLNRCLKCQIGCASCTNSQDCTTCITNWVLTGNNKCESPLKCSLPNCQICQNQASRLMCYKCISPFYLIKVTLVVNANSNLDNSTFTCVIDCPISTYKSENYSCLPCPNNCLTCYQNECSACKTTAYLFKNSCVLICPNGYILNAVLRVCTLNPCMYNSSNGNCQVCLTPFLNQDGKCVTQCGQKYYRDQMECIRCDFQTYKCDKCTKLTNCLTCVTGYFIYQGSCINVCPRGFYHEQISASNSTCKSCSAIQGCSQCTSATLCKQCNSPYFLNSIQTCSRTCPDGYYRSAYEQTCKVCQTSCLSCLNQTLCTKCSTSTILMNGDCIKDCPSGYFLQSTSNNICVLCDSKCISCSSLDNCTACQSNYFLLESIIIIGTCTQSCTFAPTSKFSCTQVCPQGFYASINSSCVACSSECLTCNFQECMSCASGKYLLNGKCLTTCPQRYFDQNGKCLICSTECKTCSQSKQSCLTCYTGFTYVASTKTCILNCTSSNQYYDTTTYACLYCSNDCETCFGPRYDQCLTCKDPFSLLNQVCVVKCPDHKFRSSNTICQSCDSSKCSSCFGSPTNCTSCVFPLVLVIQNSQGQCRVNCGTGLFYDQSNRICKQCSTGCVQCISQSLCLTCDNNRYLYNSKCVSICPSGYTSVNGTSSNQCKKCPTSCLTCTYASGNMMCTSCLNNMLLFNGMCYTNCPASSYYSSATSTCVGCDSKCQTCTSDTVCLSCKYPFVLSGTQCLLTCPVGYQAINSICYLIKTCNSVTQFTYNNLCYSQCPAGTYVSSSTCINCPTACESCVSNTMCVNCKAGFNMVIDENIPTMSCLTSCPVKTYVNNGYCVTCPLPCDQCAATNQIISCKTCLSGFLLQGKCVTTCPSGYKGVASICVKCNNNCLTCDSNGCTACANPAYNIPSCQTSNVVCSDNYFVSRITNNCQACNPACSTCYGGTASQCTSCKTLSSVDYFLYQTSCLTDCPNGYRKNLANYLCEACSIANCKVCPTTQTCTSCASNYILFTNSSVTKCVLSCSQLNTATINYIPATTTSSNCSSCNSLITNCLGCFFSTTESKTKCLTCSSSYYMALDGTCVACTGNGFFISFNKYCVQCDALCSVCSSETVCQTCITGSFLLNDKCLSTCPSGYFNNPSVNNGVCTACGSKCKVCNSTQCLQCLSPNALDVTNQCTSCISGYFLNSVTLTCQRCSSLCLQCSGTQSSCISCQPPLLLLNSKCYDKCPNGYWANTAPVVDICSSCNTLQSDCSVCSSTRCQKCKDNYFLYQQTAASTFTCRVTCPVGFYADTASMICIRCAQANCVECLSNSQCTVCSSAFILFDGSCLSTCPLGYAPSTVLGNLECQKCKAGCKSCPVSLNTCVICQSGLQNDNNGGCIVPPNICTSAQYLNTQATCSQCHQTCLTCFGGLRRNCLTCNVPQYELTTEKTCVQVCGLSQYYDSGTSQCKACSSKYGSLCTNCDSSKCFSCSSGVLSSDGLACTTSACPLGTFQQNNICVVCPRYCKSCTSATNCSQCLTSDLILYKSMCYLTCPLTTQAHFLTCRACDQKCLECFNQINNCTSCKSNYRFYQNTCLDACPAGTYQGSVAGRNNVVCLPCAAPCMNCSISSINCTSCLTNYWLYGNTCLIDCPLGYFSNITSKSCQQCKFPCSNCQLVPSNCTSCVTGYIYSSISNNCSSQCTDGSYFYTNPSTSVNSCVSCALPNCKQCDANGCYTCMNSFYGTLLNGVKVSCTQTCPDYFFVQTATSLCEKCISYCLTCTTNSNCQKCASLYVLYNNTCISSCPQKTYQATVSGSGFVCINCSSLCVTCSNNVTCTECENNAFLLNHMCYSTCPLGYYPRTTDKTCQACIVSNCQLCTATQCSSCIDTHFAYLNNSSGSILQCRSNCGDGYFANNVTRNCQNCIQGCKTCVNNSTCLQCSAPRSLLVVGSSLSCVTDCPFTYFKDVASPSQCKRCSQNCNQCLNPSTCYDCISPFVLFVYSSTRKQCISQCPISYYKTLNSLNYSYCQSCSSRCLTCLDSHICITCQSTHTLVDFVCVPNNCVNCTNCDETVDPAVCTNCTSPLVLYKVKCFDTCPVYFFKTINTTTLVTYCQKCIENCVKCPDAFTCDQCIPDYIYVKSAGCVNEAVYEYGQAANMSGFTSNITEITSAVYMCTSVGPVVFGQMSTTYFNLQFTQMMLFHPPGGNPQMTQFLNSLQTMSLTNGGTTENNNTAPQQVLARRRLLTTSTYYTESFIQVNASIFYLMFSFLAAYISIHVFQKFVGEACRVSCNNIWFYMDTICQFMQKRFKWIYFDFIMWLSYIPFMYFAILQLKQFSFENFSQGFSSILAIVIIGTYPLYPFFICYLLKSHYSEISIQPGEEQIKQTLTQMSLSPFLTKVKRPIKNLVLPFEQQDFSFGKYFKKANFILIYYPLKYVRKFAFVLVAALITEPETMVGTLIAINIAFIVYMIALRPRTMPYMIFDLIIEFVLLAFEVFLLVYLVLDGPKVAMMSIVAHAVGFITANLSIFTAIILNLIAYYKIFLCIKDLISHIKDKVAERQQAENKFQVQKKFLDPNNPIFGDKQIGKLKRMGDNDDTDEDDEELRLSHNGRRLLQNLGQKELLLNGIDPIKYIKDLTKKQNYGLQQKQLALKYVNGDDVTDSDDSDMDQNAFEIAKKLQMNQKNLALNKIHPVKYAKQLTKDDAPLDKRYKKFDEKHIDKQLAKRINDDGQTDSDDDQVDEDAMNIARNFKLDEKQLAANQINPVKYLKEDTKKDAPLEDRYKKFDEKNVDKKLARIINQDNATDSDDSQIDEDMHNLAKKLELNEKQLAFNQINPVKFFKDETKKDAPLQEQYQKFDQKHMDKLLAKRINEQNNTDSDDDSSVDQDAHNLARKLNLNEKQLAANEINPLKFFKEETKKQAPLQQVYKKFDQKNVDRQLVKIINDDGDTDSEDDSDQDSSKKDGYRLARDLNLNEKQLAANNLNPVKVIQDEAKKDQKLKNILKTFDEKDIDMKVARMINDNGQTSSEESDDQQMDKIIVARQLKLDEKQLAANNINPVKFMKESTKIDPITNEPKINRNALTTTITGKNNNKARKKLLDKELQQRNQMKKQMSENSHTDQDEEDIKISKYNKNKLKYMTEKEMMMQGLDPIKAVKRITKQAIVKKMAKQMNNAKNNRVYDDQIPDFKVSSNNPQGAAGSLKNAIRNTQQKLKQSTKNMLGSKKQAVKVGERLPSQQNNEYRLGSNLIDSESDQETYKLNNPKVNLSHKPQLNKNNLDKYGRKQIEGQWNDQFQVIADRKDNGISKKESTKTNKINSNRQKVILADPNNKIKNFDQQFDESGIISEQSSQAALNLLKFKNEQDLDAIDLEAMKPTVLNGGNSRKTINLDVDNNTKTLDKNQRNKKSNSQLNFKPQKNLKQDEMFNQFEEFQDLGNVNLKEAKQKKHQRKIIDAVNSGRVDNRGKKNLIDNEDQLQEYQIQGITPKQIRDPKYKKSQKLMLNAKVPAEVTESVTFEDNAKIDSRKNISSNKSIESDEYEKIVKKNKAGLKLPQTFQDANQAFESAHNSRPSSKLGRPAKKSNMNSDNQSDDQQYSSEVRKQRFSARQKLRSKHEDNNSEQNGLDSKRSSLVVKGDRQTRKKIEKLKIQNMSENQDDLESINM